MLNIQSNLQRRGMASNRRAFLEDLRERERARMEYYLRYREYDEGLHDSALTERLRSFLDVKSDKDFTVNYCPLVLNAKADKLSVTGFECEDSAQDDILWSWWRNNRMDRRQGIIHRAAVRDGDTFVLVEWDTDRGLPRFTYEPAFAGDGVMVYYSDEYRDSIAFASKHWRVTHGPGAGKRRRLNLYFPDRIEKYISDDDMYIGDWRPYVDETNPPNVIQEGYIGPAAVYWFTDNGTENGNPLGVPVVHFKNQDKGEQYGTSRLENVLPLQDALNKVMIDVLGLADANGFPLLVGYGDDWTSVKVGPGAVVSSNAIPSDSKLEKIPSENPAGLLSVFNAIVMEIARVTGTPLSYFQTSGQVSSADTMKQQESVLIAQVEKSQNDFGDSWEQMLDVARRLHNAFGNGEPLDQNAVISAVWDSPVVRDDKEYAETLAVYVEKLGVSKEQAQIDLGYDATQRAAFARAAMRDTGMGVRRVARQQGAATDRETNMMLEDTEDDTV